MLSLVFHALPYRVKHQGPHTHLILGVSFAAGILRRIRCIEGAVKVLGVTAAVAAGNTCGVVDAVAASAYCHCSCFVTLQFVRWSVGGAAV